MVIVSPFFIKYFVVGNVSAIALFPFIVVRHPKMRKNTKLINHERIHLRQQVEMLILFFYIWYFVEYLIGFVQFGRHYTAYRSISFEREAYANERDLQYLSKRKPWSFWKYILP